MNLKNLDAYLDSINPPLKEIHKAALSSMVYGAYLEGIEEGKKRVKQNIYNLIEKMLEDNK